MDRISISPSILAADFSRLGEQIQCVENAGADAIHLDVMDGHFVPNITFGPVVVEWIRKETQLPFWAHLMIDDPNTYLEDFINAGANGIYVHPETGQDVVRLAKIMKMRQVEPGISINPDTSVDLIIPIIHHFSRILIMTVYPGFGGQSFITDCLDRIRKISLFAQQNHPSLIVEVDGGINPETIPAVVRAGARSLVAGSAIFRQENPAEALRQIRQLADRQLTQKSNET